MSHECVVAWGDLDGEVGGSDDGDAVDDDGDSDDEDDSDADHVIGIDDDADIQADTDDNLGHAMLSHSIE
jgi:hypothetical protein